MPKVDFYVKPSSALETLLSDGSEAKKIEELTVDTMQKSGFLLVVDMAFTWPQLRRYVAGDVMLVDVSYSAPSPLVNSAAEEQPYIKRVAGDLQQALLRHLATYPEVRDEISFRHEGEALVSGKVGVWYRPQKNGGWIGS